MLQPAGFANDVIHELRKLFALFVQVAFENKSSLTIYLFILKINNNKKQKLTQIHVGIVHIWVHVNNAKCYINLTSWEYEHWL